MADNACFFLDVDLNANMTLITKFIWNWLVPQFGRK